jgi:hypothetical protein
MKAPIQVINESELAADSDLLPIVSAVQIQVNRDFAPVWGLDAVLSSVPKGNAPDPNQWWLLVSDHPEQAQEKGYSDLNPRALPLGRVYVKQTKQFGSSLSVAISQEVLGLLADPNLVELRANSTHTMVYALDPCTPVEHQRYGYRIDHVLVSDFVYPSWFNDSQTAAQYDQTKHCQAPFQVLKGGHIAALDLSQEQRAWFDLTADGQDVTSRKQHGSRLDRRSRFRGHGRRELSRVLEK